MIKQVVPWIDGTIKGIGLIGLILSLLCFWLPSFRNQIELISVRQLGVHGYVYYEITKTGELTKDGGVYLLEPSASGKYEDITPAQRLQAAHPVHLRSGPSQDNKIVFVIGTNECLMVINDPQTPIETKQAYSGGWLAVGTISCSIFN